MIAIVARMQAVEGKEADFEQVMGELGAQVREKEEGCKLYVLCKGTDPGKYVMIERYESQEALMAHGGSDHFKAAMGKLKELTVGKAEIDFLTEID